jgi:hypothetical protein
MDRCCQYSRFRICAHPNATGAQELLSYTWPDETSTFGYEVAIRPVAIPAIGEPPYKHLEGRFWLFNHEAGALALYWSVLTWAALFLGNLPSICSTARATSQPVTAMESCSTGRITERSGYEPGQAARLQPVN